MTSSPSRRRNLRIAAAALGLLFSLALGSTATAALCVAGSHEVVMSAYIANMICGMTFGWAGIPFYIYYLVVAASSSNRQSSMKTRIIPLAVFAVIGIALSGYLSEVFTATKQCEAIGLRYEDTVSMRANCKLPVASGALAWILVAITIGALLIEIISNRGTRVSRNEKGTHLTDEYGRQPLNPAV